MHVREIKNELKEKGFVYFRDARHGELWKKNGVVVNVPRGFRDGRAFHNLREDIRKAEKRIQEEGEKVARVGVTINGKNEKILAAKLGESTIQEMNDLVKAKKKLSNYFKGESYERMDDSTFRAAKTMLVSAHEERADNLEKEIVEKAKKLALPTQTKEEPVKAAEATDSSETTNQKKEDPVVATVQPIKDRLIHTPREVRSERGGVLWEQLLAGDTPALSREDLTDLLVSAEFPNPHVMVKDIILGNGGHKVSYIEENGKYLFESQDVLRMLKDRKTRILAKDEVKLVPPHTTVPAQVAYNESPVFSKNSLNVGPLPPHVINFYAGLAKKKNVTFQELITSMLINRAEKEQRRVEDLLAKEFEARRQALLADIEVY